MPNLLSFQGMTTFNLSGKEFIELNKLLKIHSLVGSGGEAKVRIREEGEAKVNGEVETQVRKKLRAGDRVEFGGEVILVEAWCCILFTNRVNKTTFCQNN